MLRVETVIIKKDLYDNVKDTKGVLMKFDLPEALPEASPLATGSTTVKGALALTQRMNPSVDKRIGTVISSHRD